MSKTRLEAFSDGVIAILITIMVLELHVPSGADWDSLRPLLPVGFAYVVSFVFVGIYWNNHHHVIHTVEKVTGGILWANLHLLFWISLIGRRRAQGPDLGLALHGGGRPRVAALGDRRRDLRDGRGDVAGARQEDRGRVGEGRGSERLRSWVLPLDFPTSQLLNSLRSAPTPGARAPAPRCRRRPARTASGSRGTRGASPACRRTCRAACWGRRTSCRSRSTRR